jgi:hypothetical protein
MIMVHLHDINDDHAADWYLIYRERGSKMIQHKVFTTWAAASAELKRHVNEGISNVDEIIIRPYRLAQNIQVA